MTGAQGCPAHAGRQQLGPKCSGVRSGFARHSNCHIQALSFSAAGRGKAAPIPDSARPHCILGARDLRMLALVVFGLCRWSAYLGRFLGRLLPNCTNFPFKMGLRASPPCGLSWLKKRKKSPRYTTYALRLLLLFWSPVRPGIPPRSLSRLPRTRSLRLLNTLSSSSPFMHHQHMCWATYVYSSSPSTSPGS